MNNNNKLGKMCSLTKIKAAIAGLLFLTAGWAYGVNQGCQVLQEAFGSEALVEAVSGGYKVTLGADVPGPVLIPNNLGSVTVDLKGHSIDGADAVLPEDLEERVREILENPDEEVFVGECGSPGIQIYGDSGSQSAFHLSLVNTAGDQAYVRGGNGVDFTCIPGLYSWEIGCMNGGCGVLAGDLITYDYWWNYCKL